MKKFLATLVICGLSVGGTCFGSKATLWQSDGRESKLNFVDVSKVRVVNAGEGFLRDYGRMRDGRLSSDRLASLYGTRDGVVYRVGDNKNVFLRYEGGPSKKSASFASYCGDPIKGLDQGREDLRKLEKWEDDFTFNSFSSFDHLFDRFDDALNGFFSFGSSLFDGLQHSFDDFSSFDDVKIRSRNLETENNFDYGKSKVESFAETEVFPNLEKSDVANVFGQRKKDHTWIKNASLLSAGALIGGGLVILKTNPEFCGNVISTIKDSSYFEYVSSFYKNAVLKVSDSDLWRVISELCKNAILKVKGSSLYGTVKGFF